MTSPPTQQPTDKAQAAGPLQKRRRVRNNQNTNELKKCHIQTLPFELMAEILMYTNCPKTVLSVTRTCKFYFELLYGGQDYIWRHVRKNSMPSPLPDPLQYMSELSLAAIVFDEGKCEVCPFIGCIPNKATNIHTCRYVDFPLDHFHSRIRCTCGYVPM